MSSYRAEIFTPGYSFINYARNSMLLHQSGSFLPNIKKTGTTIVGIVYADGVILGAETRATEDTIVSDKNSKKIHYLQPNIYCCGAGIASDTEMTTRLISSELELRRMQSNRAVRVITANKLLKQYLFKHGGNIGAALLVGGVDSTGFHLYCIYPHGSSDRLPYTTMGSGALSAMSVLEIGWRPNLQEADAVKMVREAVLSGVNNDLGSGSFVDICIIRKQSVHYTRKYEKLHTKNATRAINFVKGITPVLSTKIFDMDVVHEMIIPTERIADDKDDAV